MRIDHIGIAVRSIEESLPFYTQGLGLPLRGIEEVPTEKVRVAMIECAEVRIELLEPLSEDSPIRGFLDKRGPGIHHVAYRVDDVREKIADLSAKGVALIPPAPRPGAHGCSVAFVHPKAAGGVLVELVEPAHA